jgi:hypothetical protein
MTWKGRLICLGHRSALKYGHKIDRDNPSYCYSTQNVPTDFDKTDGKDAMVHEQHRELDDTHGGNIERFKCVAQLY